jgi:hypothetical protein
MNELNPVWIGIGLNGLTAIVTWVVAHNASKRGTEVALARFEERQNSQGLHIGRLQDQVTTHGGLLADHAVRLGVIENEVGLRAPLDYPRRG